MNTTVALISMTKTVVDLTIVPSREINGIVFQYPSRLIWCSYRKSIFKQAKVLDFKVILLYKRPKDVYIVIMSFYILF